jgi:hypothetical protein
MKLHALLYRVELLPTNLNQQLATSMFFLSFLSTTFSQTIQESEWLASSELCLVGRADGQDVPAATLPKHHELLIPTTTNPDEDILLAERYRPSVETTSAQKGAELSKTCTCV